MSYDPDFEYKNAEHFRTRATGQLWMGPLQAVGYNNKVIQVTANELEFNSSVEAQRFMEYQRKKWQSPRGMCRAKKMKFLSKYDDR